MNRSATPRERFQADKKLMSNHADLLDHPSFDTSIDYALAQYALQTTTHLTDASAGFHRIAGAQEFVKLLKTLGQTVTPQAKQDTVNLNHRA